MEKDEKNVEETKMGVLPRSSRRDQMLVTAEEEALDFVNPKKWEMMNKIATIFLQSGALPKGIDTFPKLMMVLQAGVEAGMKPLQAINSFYIVNGKVSMYGEQCIAQVLKAGHKVVFSDCNSSTATCKITRKDNGESLESTFTMQMANERGLSKNPPYKSAPENMLKFKAFHMTAKFIVPEALHGIEVGEVIESETVHREVEVVHVDKSVAETQRKAPAPAKSLEEALEAPDEKPVEEPKPAKRKRAAKEEPKQEEVATEKGESNAVKLMKQGMAKSKAPVEEAPVEIMESTDQKFERLVREGTDRRLTPAEAKFVAEYPATKERGNKLV